MASIIVVDDYAGSRQFVTTILRREGHAVRDLEPTCLLKLLEALHQDPPDLLVTDLVMPGCPGQTLIRACREDAHLKNIRILLLTAHGDTDLARFLQSMGNTHYLAKPVSPPVLAECVERLLQQDLEPDPGWALACHGVVAVVDDSRLSRSFHTACLRKAGFNGIAIEPTELLETVRAIEENEPELLLVDFLMPQFRGDALIRAVRAREPLKDIPILVVTAHRADDLVTLLRPLQGVEILFKPIRPEDLVARVSRILKIEPSPGGAAP